MIGSLRLRLFAALLLATSLIWLAAVVWIYLGSRREVEHVLDTRLQEAARMVVSLASGLERSATQPPEAALPKLGNYERQLSCQVWSLDGRMIAKSSGAPEQRLSEARSGFSEPVIDGEAWRVFTVEDPTNGIRVMVGDRIGLRERLVADLIKGLMWPALLIAPLLGLLIWVSVGRGLRPLRRIAQDLSQREADDMRPVDVPNAPAEVRPLAAALNALFGKVEATRRHEREVTAFAAHELRTPLAGLKTQAQVALAATDPAVTREALHQIVAAVDRSARLVSQLLAMARLEAQSEPPAKTDLEIGRLLRRVTDAYPRGQDVRVSIGDCLSDVSVTANEECLELAIRNLHENALQHAPAGGVVAWTSENGSLVVEDDGPGASDDELPSLGTRFFRGRNRSQAGSGLGLAIARIALQRTGAGLVLRNRPGHRGFRAEITLPQIT